MLKNRDINHRLRPALLHSGDGPVSALGADHNVSLIDVQFDVRRLA